MTEKKLYPLDLKTTYRLKRKKLFDKGQLPRMIRIRRYLHPVLIRSIKIARIISKQKLNIVSDKRTSHKGPFVYACNHIGWDDIQMTFEAIHDHAWLFWGNPEYRALHYYLLMANGAVCLDTNNKTDRKIAKETSMKLLQKGDSLLIYPEGIWNVVPNLPVMKLFTGAAEIAIATSVDIIPIGISQNGPDEYYVSIGENISASELQIKNKYELTKLLRDRIATEVWNTWNAQPKKKRSDFHENASQQFEDFLTAQMHGVFTIEDCHRERYHDQYITSFEDAFSHLNRIELRTETAFLLRRK